MVGVVSPKQKSPKYAYWGAGVTGLGLSPKKIPFFYGFPKDLEVLKSS